MNEMYVYIMANRSRTLYIGVTNDIVRRAWEHKHMQVDGFTRRYLIDRLVYYENVPGPESAVRREKQLKGWLRRRKIALIESVNPKWQDFSLHFLDIRTAVPAGPFSPANRSRRDSSRLLARPGAEANGVPKADEPAKRTAQNDRGGVTS